MRAKARVVRDVKEAESLKLRTDFRPHNHFYRLDEQIYSCSTESGQVALGGAMACGFRTGWGDGLFPVYCDFAADGAMTRIRIDVGNEKIVARQRRMEELWFGEFSKLAMVTDRVSVEKRPVLWLYREAPMGETDSGWRIFAGDEKREYLDDAKNSRFLPLRELLSSDKTLEPILRQPMYSAFERDDLKMPFRAVEWSSEGAEEEDDAEK